MRLVLQMSIWPQFPGKPAIYLGAATVVAYGAGIVSSQKRAPPPPQKMGSYPKPSFDGAADRALGLPMQPVLISHPTDGTWMELSAYTDGQSL